MAGQPSIAHPENPAPAGAPRLALRSDGGWVAAKLDLLALALGLPIFLAFGFSMLGYAVCAAAWLAGRAMHAVAERRAAGSLARGNRRGALGAIAAATLGRVWLVTLSILIVGLIEREAGLAAAVLAAALVTAYLCGQGISRLLEPVEAER